MNNWTWLEVIFVKLYFKVLKNSKVLLDRKLSKKFIININMKIVKVIMLILILKMFIELNEIIFYFEVKKMFDRIYLISDRRKNTKLNLKVKLIKFY